MRRYKEGGVVHTNEIAVYSYGTFNYPPYNAVSKIRLLITY